MKNLVLHPKIIISIVLSIGILFYIFSKILSNDSIKAIEKTAKVIRETKKIHNFAKTLNEVAKNSDKTTEATNNDKNNKIDSSEYYKFYSKSQLSEMKKCCLPVYKNGKLEFHAVDQAVFKWHGKISYEEFMNTFKSKQFVTKKGLYRITEKWSMPMVEHNDGLRAGTIHNTNNYLKTFLNE